MAEEEPEEKKSKVKEKMGQYAEKIKSHEGVKKGVNFLWDRRMEFFSGALMLVGIVLAFFYTHIGGGLVGLGFGICFCDEIRAYFVRLRDLFTEHSLFKTVMLVGTIVYFLIVIRAFVIAAAIGFGVMCLVCWEYPALSTESFSNSASAPRGDFETQPVCDTLSIDGQTDRNQETQAQAGSRRCLGGA